MSIRGLLSSGGPPGSIAIGVKVFRGITLLKNSQRSIVIRRGDFEYTRMRPPFGASKAYRGVGIAGKESRKEPGVLQPNGGVKEMGGQRCHIHRARPPAR